MTRRPSRRRARRPAAPPPLTSDRAPSSTEHQPASEPTPPAAEPRGFGRAALVLALLLGTLVERAVLSLPQDARNTFHFIVFLVIALLVARAYRGFVRRTIERSRERRRNR